MSDTPIMHCIYCNNDYSATDDNFSPSSRKYNHHKCRRCVSRLAREYSEKKAVVRNNLINSAQPIDKDDLSLYVFLYDLAKRIGCSTDNVERMVHDDNIPRFSIKYTGGLSVNLAIGIEDAEKYIASYQAQSGVPDALPDEAIATPQELPQTSVQSGPLDPTKGAKTQCGACGTIEGAIRADTIRFTDICRGYLCTPCWKLALVLRDWVQDDSDRIDGVLDYLRRTMLE